MNDKVIEARLERSLRNQMKAPRLPKSFDAAVWSRIEAQTVRRPAVAHSSRWFLVFNALAIGIAVVMLGVFGLQSLSGIEANLMLPQLAVASTTIDEITNIAVQAVTIGSLVFGLMFTPWGKRLRAEFS